jgi:hypothetical protein
LSAVPHADVIFPEPESVMETPLPDNAKIQELAATVVTPAIAEAVIVAVLNPHRKRKPLWLETETVAPTHMLGATPVRLEGGWAALFSIIEAVTTGGPSTFA